MPVRLENYRTIRSFLEENKVTLVAVSKTKPVEDILELYNLGQRDFGENYVQELVAKQKHLPQDIRWHFIGHLQSNKVKLIAPFVYLIQSVDSKKLLKEISKEATKNEKIINCLLQVHIAKEETKFGLDENELNELVVDGAGEMALKNIYIKGLMGMASFTDDELVVRKEFNFLRSLFDKYSLKHSAYYDFQTLSMGMSADYRMAIEEGSNTVRIGSLLFGERNYANS
ncbi:MAG: YggS family pyridoxal phosphate-dependent enzyme [Ginsengibacter sp.]